MLAEVAAASTVPLVVLLDKNVPGQAQERGGVGESANDVGASFDLPVDTLERVRGPDLSPVLLRESAEREDVILRVLEHVTGGQAISRGALFLDVQASERGCGDLRAARPRCPLNVRVSSASGPECPPNG